MTTASVVIVTWCRPSFVLRCLTSLDALKEQPFEVIVVDASPDLLTKQVVDAFAAVTYVSFPRGAGHMTTSRNAGLLRASGDIVAFLDDDTVVRETWLEGLLDTFEDPGVSAVAGRTCNAQLGEELEGADLIGRLLPDGRLTGFFAADPGVNLEVDHGIGANMAFRRKILGELGGFRDDFGGVGGVREDTDVFLRVRSLGGRTLFSPDAVVDHLGAPHVRGRRFDFRYEFWARRNHGLLLSRNFGMSSRLFRSWVGTELKGIATGQHSSSSLKRVAKALLGFVGVLAALEVSVRKGGYGPTTPIRRDEVGCALTRWLTASGPNL
jgi:GT2 family glycosyltransferase